MRTTLKLTQEQLKKMLEESYRMCGEDHTEKLNRYKPILDVSVDDMTESELSDMPEKLADVFMFILDLDDGIAGIDHDEEQRLRKAQRRKLFGIPLPWLRKKV